METSLQTPTTATRQTGRSDGQIVRLLGRREHDLIYVVPPGHSAGYYLAIACRYFWGWEDFSYEVDHRNRTAKFAHPLGRGHQHIRFKEFNSGYVIDPLTDPHVYVEFDHGCEDAIECVRKFNPGRKS
jgi:hypothetical protein